MKFKEYERPELEEIELLLEGSFQNTGSVVDRGEDDDPFTGDGDND